MASVISEFSHQYFHINHFGLIHIVPQNEGAQYTFNSVHFPFMYDSLRSMYGEMQREASMSL